MSFAMRLIGFTMIGAAASSSGSWAQKPALTESIDEPGRAPYSETLSVGPSLSGRFSAVPAGKRLVMKYVNCLGTTFTYRGFVVFDLGALNLNSFVQNTFLTPPAPSGNFAYYALNSDVLAYADSAFGPSIAVSPTSDFNGSCTLTGYYVTLP